MGIEDVFWLAVLGAAAAIATLIMFISWISGKIYDFIKAKEKELADLEADHKKAEEQRKENREKAKALDAAISNVEAQVANAGSAVDAASLAYTAAAKAHEAAQRDVRNKSAALSKAQKDYTEHTNNCYYCQQMSDCRTRDYLHYCVNAASKDLEYAKRRLGIAEGNYKTAGSDLTNALNALDKSKEELSNLRQAMSDLEKAHGKLLTEITKLNTQISAKKTEIDEGKADLSTTNKAKTAGPEYMTKFNEAKKAGKDMGQWVKDNPAPESVKSFVDLIEKYSD